MKVFHVLGGLLLLLVPVHSFRNLFITCTEHWLRVRVRRTPYVDELQPQMHELYLGTGCPVSRVLPDFFEFIYSLSSCGIRKDDHFWYIYIESSLYYEPAFLNIRGYIPIGCVTERKFSFNFLSKEVATNSSASGEASQEPLENNTSMCQAGSMEAQPGPSLVNSFFLGHSNCACFT